MHETLNQILFWNGIFWVLVYGYAVFVHKGIPSISTEGPVRDALIKVLREDMAARGLPDYTIVDVGSGNGILSREIARQIPEAKVIGIEIAKDSILWANWQKKRLGLQNLEYRQMDFLAYDFAEADAVVMYLLPNILTTMGRRLREGLRDGVLIACNRFPLGDGWQPCAVQEISMPLQKRKLFLYRK